MLRLRTTLIWSVLVIAAAVGASVWMSAWPRLHDRATEAAVAARRRAPDQAPQATPRAAARRPHAAARASMPAPPTAAPTSPAPVFAPSPPYPIAALRARRDGVVTLRVTVDDAGAVTDVAIAASSGDVALDAAARTTVMRWRFTAPRGHAPMTFDYPIRFRIRAGARP